jgi:hypothetical protein
LELSVPVHSLHLEHSACKKAIAYSIREILNPEIETENKHGSIDLEWRSELDGLVAYTELVYQGNRNKPLAKSEEIKNICSRSNGTGLPQLCLFIRSS